MGDSDWARQRTEAAQIQAERLRARQAAESERAAAMLRAFVDAAERTGLEAQPLRVLGYGGRGSARTPLHGWYLRLDRTAAVGTDGAFYVLTAPLSILERVRGTRPSPSPPPLVLGAGGRDGDSIDLDVALERLIPGWRDQA